MLLCRLEYHDLLSLFELLGDFGACGSTLQVPGQRGWPHHPHGGGWGESRRVSERLAAATHRQEFIDGAARLRGSAKARVRKATASSGGLSVLLSVLPSVQAIDIWRLETKLEVLFEEAGTGWHRLAPAVC